MRSSNPSTTVLGTLFRRVGAGGVVASLTLLLGFFLGDALLHEGASAEIGYVSYAVAVFSLLGAAGVTSYAGYLLLFGLRSGDFGPGQRMALRLPSETLLPGEGPGEDWPLLVSLLFSPFSALFAGLAGWVGVHVNPE